jgi:hypothetical protein
VGTVAVMLPSNETGWVAFAGRSDPLPFFIAGLEQPFTLAPLDEIDGLYVRYTANVDVGAVRIADFNDAVRAAVQESQPAVLVIDQRLNGGGDYTTTIDLMRDLPRLLPARARIYVLTGPLTFSAGISSVAFLKDAGGGQVVIVGEPAGDWERHWGETVTMTLPNSGLNMTLATGLHDYAGGCWTLPNCYWLDFFNNVAIGSLDPDVEVAFSFADYAAGVDAVMEVVYEMEVSQ